MAVAIKARPRKAYSIGLPTRNPDSTTYAITLNYGGDIGDEKNSARAEELVETWRIGLICVQGNSKGKKQVMTFESRQRSVTKKSGW